MSESGGFFANQRLFASVLLLFTANQFVPVSQNALQKWWRVRMAVFMTRSIVDGVPLSRRSNTDGNKITVLAYQGLHRLVRSHPGADVGNDRCGPQHREGSIARGHQR
jgi:hypothetical protein